MILNTMKFILIVIIATVFFGAFLSACDKEYEINKQNNKEWAKNGGF